MLLTLTAPAYAGTSYVSSDAVRCLALNLYHEARGEEPIGIIAVGNVVINRVYNKHFPNDVCSVIKQGGERRHRCQFSWWCDGRSDKAKDKKAWRDMLIYAQLILSRRLADPTNGALFYHATYVYPYWSKEREHSVTLGQHIFYQ